MKYDIKSEYLQPFKDAAKHFTLAGNRMLVERIDLGEVKTAGGLIIADSSSIRSDLRMQKPMICLVLAVGEGYSNEADPSGPKIPLDCKPGNVVMLNALGVSFYDQLPGAPFYTKKNVGLTSESDVQMRFNSIEEFNVYTQALNSEITPNA